MNAASRYPPVALLRIASRVALAFVVATALITSAAVFSLHSVQAQEFDSGDSVVVFASMLNVRSARGLSAEIKSVVPNGTEFTINSGPFAMDGYSWYSVSYTTGTGSGWVAGEYLTLTGVNTGFTVGDWVFVASTNLNFRADLGLDADIQDVVPFGTEFTIVSGATNADGYDWYEVSNATVYGTGWVAGEFLEFGGNGGGGRAFDTGDTVQTTSVLNVRDGAGLDATVFRTARVGELFTVTASGTSNDGYTWYKVTSSTEDMPLTGDAGWVAGEFLTFAD